jgi:subtilisin family serine protease
MIRGATAHARFPIALLLGLATVLVSSAGCGALPSAPLAAHPQRVARFGVGLDAPPGLVLMVKAGVNPDQVAAEYGGTVVDAVPELGIYRIALPAGDDAVRCAQAMLGDTRVSAAEVNAIAMIAESRQSSVAFSEGNRSWADVHDQGALARIGGPRAQTAANGSGVLVAILDTGISFVHPAFVGRLTLPGIEPGVDIWPGAERPQQVDSNHDGIVDGALGHGTHVAGIVLAVAPRAHLLPVRVLDSDGVGTAFDVANGIAQATDRGAQVINMSLGISSPSTAVMVAIRYARDHGAVVVAPTGNNHLGWVEFPASMPEVVAVAGLDSLDQHSSFTNYGFGTDLAAPSTGILSAYFGGGYARWSGTSMAAPFVSGTAALLCGLLPRGASAPSQVEGFLMAGAASLSDTDPAYAGALGAGRVDAAASMNALHHATGGVDGEFQRLK